MYNKTKSINISSQYKYIMSKTASFINILQSRRNLHQFTQTLRLIYYTMLGYVFDLVFFVVSDGDEHSVAQRIADTIMANSRQPWLANSSADWPETLLWLVVHVIPLSFDAAAKIDIFYRRIQLFTLTGVPSGQ